jgi:formylglycine-generating enzyme required for sulfatase activity
MSERPRLSAPKHNGAEDSRLVPLTVAGVVCFAIATALGYGGWYLFGTHAPAKREMQSGLIVQSPAVSPQSAPPTEQSPARLAPAGELPVAGGEITLGGEDSGMPLKREFVEPFHIGETEVTNEQYREFVKARGYKTPGGWKGGEFPAGAALEPVTNVTWHDAIEYCKWLSVEVGADVRLPTEAEWELAARGKEGRRYPWGNEWDARAADSEESHGRVRAVKSFPAGKSSTGAFDMAGNVWEWVADPARDAEGRPKTRDNVALYVIKGGSALEPRSFVNATSRYEVAADKGSARLGFRYLVRRQNAAGTANGPSN